MHPAATLPCCFVFLVVLAAGCATKSDQAPVVLRCTGAAGTDEAVVEALCDALSTELATRAPDQKVRRAAPGVRSAPGIREGMLEVVRTDRSVWEARLTWTSADTKDDEAVGPFVQIVSMDAPLGLSAYRHFARSILEVSGAPH